MPMTPVTQDMTIILDNSTAASCVIIKEAYHMLQE